MREKLENVEGIDKIIFYPGKLIYQFELQLGLYVIPGQGGHDVATGFVHRIVNLARTFASQLRHPGELGEIIAEIVNIRHSNGDRLNLWYGLQYLSLCEILRVLHGGGEDSLTSRPCEHVQ